MVIVYIIKDIVQI